MSVIPEFKIGDTVTYWPERKGTSTVVLDVFIAADRIIYRLIEAAEGKPLEDHPTVLTEPVNILESRHYVRKRSPTSLGSIGDPMSELNVQRLINYCRENPPRYGKCQYYSQDIVNITPGLAQVIAAIPWMKIRG